MAAFLKLEHSFEIWRQASGSRVGFIGLGNMGGPMAINLIKKGEMDLLVYDVSEENLNRVVGEGATATSGPAEIAAECDKIVTMLPNSPHVESVYASLLVSFLLLRLFNTKIEHCFAWNPFPRLFYY